MHARHAHLHPALWLAAVALAAIAAPAHATISGVCPDGSFFVVQQAENVPCRNAKRVAPGDLPPLKPELLPRPYRWEVFNRKNNPNNPYNLVDGEPGQAPQPAVGESAPAPRGALPAVEAPPPPRRAAAPGRAAALALSDGELRDLEAIVALSQRQAPAAIEDDGGVTLRLAHSQSFEPLARASLGGDGPVLLFSAEAASPGEFHPNLTFVQGHVAFHPDTDDPGQLGLLRGGAGALGAGASVLGYVVLPEHVDLEQPIDVYWDDRRLTTSFRP